MDIHALLEEVLTIKGITSVALVSEDGFVIESATLPNNPIDLEFLGGVVTSSLKRVRFCLRLWVGQTFLPRSTAPKILGGCGFS
jgi:hypothetical protein